MSLLRKLRALVTMSVTWGIAWVPLALGAVTGLSLLAGQWPGTTLLGAAAVTGLLAGSCSGALFGVLLAWTERGQTVAGLSGRRVAALGILAGLLPAGVMVAVTALQVPGAYQSLAEILVRVVAITSILGAVSAGGLLWTVRRAPELPPDRSAPELPDGAS